MKIRVNENVLRSIHSVIRQMENCYKEEMKKLEEDLNRVDWSEWYKVDFREKLQIKNVDRIELTKGVLEP